MFPYVNGGLFSGNMDVPRFSRIARSYLLHIGSLDWKRINPDIFGSMIQAVAEDEERGALGMHYTSVPNILKMHPTFFRFAGKDEGELLARAAHLDRRVRIAFDTDVVDDYFTRKVDRGQKEFVRILKGKRVPLTDYTGPNPADGRANLSIDLPEDLKVGEVLELELIVRDPATGAEFINKAKLAILAAVETHSGDPKKKKPASEKPGDQQDGQAGLDLPKVNWIKPDAPNWKNYFETLDDCLKIIDDGEEDKSEFFFYLNEGNKALQNELKNTKLAAAAVKKQFEIGIVLVGMAMIHDDKTHQPKKPAAEDAEGEKEDNGGKKDDSAVSKQAAQFTRAIAPVIIPIIQSLGDLADEEVDLSDLVGHAEAA